MENKAFYLGDRGGIIRAMLEDELDFVYNEQKGESIDIKEFMKNKLRNISVPKYMIVDVKALHMATSDLLIELKNSVVELNERFKCMILLLNDAIDKNISDDMKSHARNGKNYVIMEESNEEKLIEKLKNKIIELEKGEVIKEEVAQTGNETENNDAGNDNENKITNEEHKDIRSRQIIKADTVSARDMKRHILGGKKEGGKIESEKPEILEKNDKREALVKENAIDISIPETEKTLSDFKDRFRAFEPDLEVDENLSDLLYTEKNDSNNREWKITGQNILVIGCDRRVGATFIALSLAQSLAKEKAYAMYCLASSDNAALDDKANDYNFVKKSDNYYSYNDVPFTRILTDKNANFVVYDIDMQLAKRTFSNKKIAKAILISDGNTQGLRNLKASIKDLKTVGIDNYDIIIVNAIFDKDIYNELNNEKVSVYHWEHCGKPTEKAAINQECLAKIISDLYDLELENRYNENTIEELEKGDEIEVIEAEI